MKIFGNLYRSPTRLFSTIPEGKKKKNRAAQEAAKNLSEKFSGSIIHNTQLLDANQLQRLCVTLGRSHLHGTVPSPVHSLAHIPTSRTRLPRGYHLVYFTPYCFEKDLEPDGAESSQVYNQIIPPPPFTRRMWAGGSIEWFKQSLRVNHFAHETTKLARASAKQSHGDWKLRLNIEKAYYLARGENPGQIALIDRRTWIYSKPEPVVDGPVCVSESSLLPPEYKTEILDMPDGTQQLIYSPVALFRFSALIFNSHMIHYNESWTRQKEGHPGLVVHVPLIIINVLDFWRDSCRRGDRSHKGPVSTKKIDYRIMAPIYAGERFTIEILPTEERCKEDPTLRKNTVNVKKLNAEKEDVLCMTAQITWEPSTVADSDNQQLSEEGEEEPDVIENNDQS